MSRYKRVLIKLSGGAMAGGGGVGFDESAVEQIVREVLSVREIGVEAAIMVGGGNFFRGELATEWGIERAEADQIGMLGTVLNAMMLRGALKAHWHGEVRVMTAVPMDTFAEPYIRLRAIQHLSKGYLIILAAGIGQPYVTTDYPSVQRALETRCEAILVAKQGVSGVFDSDPKTNPSARRYRTLAYDDMINQRLKVMDHSAVLLAQAHNLPIHVFNFEEVGAMKTICTGGSCGTLIAPHTTRQFADPES